MWELIDAERTPDGREVGDDPSRSSGPTVDPYDRSKPLQDDGRCGTVSRS